MTRFYCKIKTTIQRLLKRANSHLSLVWKVSFTRPALLHAHKPEYALERKVLPCPTRGLSGFLIISPSRKPLLLLLSSNILKPFSFRTKTPSCLLAIMWGRDMRESPGCSFRRKSHWETSCNTLIVVSKSPVTPLYPAPPCSRLLTCSETRFGLAYI